MSGKKINERISKIQMLMGGKKSMREKPYKPENEMHILPYPENEMHTLPYEEVSTPPFNPEGEGKCGGKKYKKGSPEAKAHMAKIRSMRGGKRTGGMEPCDACCGSGVKDTLKSFVKKATPYVKKAYEVGKVVAPIALAAYAAHKQYGKTEQSPVGDLRPKPRKIKEQSATSYFGKPGTNIHFTTGRTKALDPQSVYVSPEFGEGEGWKEDLARGIYKYAPKVFQHVPVVGSILAPASRLLTKGISKLSPGFDIEGEGKMKPQHKKLLKKLHPVIYSQGGALPNMKEAGKWALKLGVPVGLLLTAILTATSKSPQKQYIEHDWNDYGSYGEPNLE